MMTAFVLSVPRPSGRLAVGLALSVLAHLAVVAHVRPLASAYAPPRPFQVDIRQSAETRPDAPLAVANDAGFSAPGTAAAPSVVPPRREATPPPPNTAAARVPGLDLRFVPDDYLSAREVDVRAEPVNDVDLVYPQLAYQKRVKGSVVLRLLINERGGIDQVSVLESEPRGVFEEAALAATWALQFTPAKKHGRDVKSRKDIRVDFDPYESIHIP